MSAARADRQQLAALLTQCGRGDQQAFAELYAHTSGKLYGICLRLLHDQGTAAEILQEAYITIWHRADRFDGARASAMTWLITITRNKAIDYLRKHREDLLDDPAQLEWIAGDDPSPASEAETLEEYRHLRECLDTLEAQQRDAVREAFFSGATYKQLAARRNMPLGTMKSWIRRSLIRLRTCLEDPLST